MKSLIPWFVAVPIIVSSISAQQVDRTWVEVTPDGVYEHREVPRSATTHASRAGGAIPIMSLALLRWTYPNPPGTPWITESVSVGNSGTFAWLGQNLNGQLLSLVATTDDAGSPPNPIFEPLFPGAALDVRAADKSTAAVVGEIVGSSSTFNLHYLTGFSSTPVHTIPQPAASKSRSRRGHPFHIRLYDRLWRLPSRCVRRNIGHADGADPNAHRLQRHLPSS